MSIIGVIFLVVFVIICVLLICLVLVQSEEGGGMGGLFGDASSKAFGSRSGNVLTKTTYTLVTLFFVTTFILAFLNRAPAAKQLDASVLDAQTTTQDNKSWLDEDTAGNDIFVAPPVQEEAASSDEVE
jgi:preprotein translocase subunit SecG